MNGIRKYRAKRIDNGEWVYGAYLAQYHSQQYGRIDAIFWSDEWKTYRVPVDPNTVGQSTGIYERVHGPQVAKEIFAGDIVRNYGGECRNGFYEVDLTILVDSNNWQHLMALEEYEFCEVIGNIWEVGK